MTFGVFVSAWTKYLDKEIKHYHNFFMGWLKSYNQERYIVHYEDLKEDLGPPLNGVVKYLTGKDIKPSVLKCIYDNSEGKYHRKSSKEDEEFDPYSAKWREKVTNLQKEIYTEIDNCLKSGKCIDYLKH